MKYTYPIINNISDVLPALEGRDEFIIADRPGYKVVNYLVNFEDTFPQVIGQDVSNEQYILGALRRECRGIKFDSVTGDIICRPLQKFFNVNEKIETHAEFVDISLPHVILEKLDGSFIAPFIANGRMIYGTKMGETNVSELVHKHIADKPQYQEFNEMLLQKGFTPTYEYVGPDNRIVIAYRESKLILLAIRNMRTGEYHDYETMLNLAVGFDIPVVGALPGSAANMQAMVSEFRNLIDVEGYVVRFASGYSIKIKADEYVLKHKVKDSISQEKNLVQMIFLDKIDDAYATLDQSDADKVKLYADSVLHNVTEIVKKVNELVAKNRPLLNDEKKRFALEVVPNHKDYAGILFSVWDGKDALECIRKTVLNNCATQSKIDGVRVFLGNLKWADVYSSVPDLDG